MAGSTSSGSAAAERKSSRDIGFAGGIIGILSIFFLPVPAVLIDIGLAFSIAFSVLVLMVALWIERPLDFSAFPTVLLVATLLRLALSSISPAKRSASIAICLPGIASRVNLA